MTTCLCRSERSERLARAPPRTPPAHSAAPPIGDPAELRSHAEGRADRIRPPGRPARGEIRVVTTVVRGEVVLTVELAFAHAVAVRHPPAERAALQLTRVEVQSIRASREVAQRRRTNARIDR